MLIPDVRGQTIMSRNGRGEQGEPFVCGQVGPMPVGRNLQADQIVVSVAQTIRPVPGNVGSEILTPDFARIVQPLSWFV